jgi:hypothetical protein
VINSVTTVRLPATTTSAAPHSPVKPLPMLVSSPPAASYVVIADWSSSSGPIDVLTLLTNVNPSPLLITLIRPAPEMLRRTVPVAGGAAAVLVGVTSLAELDESGASCVVSTGVGAGELTG